MRPGDVFLVSWQGGGYADPLLRPPEKVGRDVRAGLLTEAGARHGYGVVLDGGAVNLGATRQTRRQARAERVGHDVVDPPEACPPRGGLGPALQVTSDHEGVAVRTAAGAVLCRGSTRWRSGAVARRVDPAGYGITLHRDLAMTAFYCPLSGVQLAVDTHLRDEEPFDDLDLVGAWIARAWHPADTAGGPDRK